MNARTFRLLPLLIMLGVPALHAAAPCANFKWDVSQEVALFRQSPTTISAGARADTAPLLEAGRLYEAGLIAQPSVALAAPPTKKMLDDGAHAGLFRLRLTSAGLYRISTDAGFWVDVVAAGRPLASADFNGDTECKAPRKIVVYELPADTDLIVQFNAADSDRTRFAITKVAAGAP